MCKAPLPSLAFTAALLFFHHFPPQSGPLPALLNPPTANCWERRLTRVAPESETPTLNSKLQTQRNALSTPCCIPELTGHRDWLVDGWGITGNLSHNANVEVGKSPKRIYFIDTHVPGCRMLKTAPLPRSFGLFSGIPPQRNPTGFSKLPHAPPYPHAYCSSLNDLRRTEKAKECIAAVNGIARVSLSPASPSCSWSTVYSHSASGRQTAPFQHLLMLIGPERWKFALCLFSNVAFCLSNACGWPAMGDPPPRWSQTLVFLSPQIAVTHHSWWGEISPSSIIMHV